MGEMLSFVRDDRYQFGFSSAFGLVSEVTDRTIAGDLDTAARLRSDMVVELERVSAPGATAYGATTGLGLARELGSFEELDDLLELMEQMGHPTSAPRAIGAFLRHVRDESDVAVAALDGLANERFADDAGLPISLGLWSEIAADLGLESHCRRFVDELSPLSGIQVVTGGITLGAADRLLARLLDALDEHDAADRHFASAVEQHEALRSPPWIARTRLDWAESLLARERRSDAVAQVDAAEAAIGDLDLPDNQRRLDALRARL